MERNDIDLHLEPFLLEIPTPELRERVRRYWERLRLKPDLSRWKRDRENWVRHCLKSAAYEPSLAEIHMLIGHAELLFNHEDIFAMTSLEPVEEFLDEMLEEMTVGMGDADVDSIIFLALLALLCFLYLQWLEHSSRYFH